MSASYGHAYLTSYGWSGTGTGLRKGAIDKPLAIPPKKNLSGLGKDRDDAFPFWDHLFTATSKAITIKLSSDDDNDDDNEGEEGEDSKTPRTDSDSTLRRTTTGILSNRRPTLGTPATTSGSTTPDPALARPSGSLLATAKREAAKRGLYARFFRGPVLGPDSEDVDAPCEESFSLMLESDSVRSPTKRKLRDEEETREQRRERKRLKMERKAAKAAKRAERAMQKDKVDDPPPDRKDRKQRDKKVRDESKRAHKHTRKSLQRSGCQESVESDGAPLTSNVVPTPKKKRRRKDTLP